MSASVHTLHPSRSSADRTPEDRRTSQEWRERERWVVGQRRAFEAALGDAPLAYSLGILSDTVAEIFGVGVRAAFYLTDDEGSSLHHVVGMPARYAEAVDGFRGGPETLPSSHVAEPSLTADVRQDVRWKAWVGLADEYGYRGCWTFPVRTAGGRPVGTFAVYWPEPREACPEDVEHVEIILPTAAIIISRHEEAAQRRLAEGMLQAELQDSELLRQISLELADEDNQDVVYEKLVRTGAKIMRSEICTMQVFHPERGPAGELQMLASIGLPPDGQQFWEWVRGDSGCTCGEVLRTGRRAVAEDVETCAFMAGKPDREALLRNGIRAGQSTPLITRDGKLIGMISTHWAKPHRPQDRSLRMLDILARSTADLIERRRSAETQRLLLNELNHRVKNTLAVVQAMAQRTLAKSNDPKAFAKSFGGRIEALARAHNMLSAKSWQSADLREMIGDQLLLGAVDASRLAMSGPDVRLDAQAALHMALVLHELGTNATKYAGLSVPEGRVSINWKAEDRLRIVWMERDQRVRHDLDRPKRQGPRRRSTNDCRTRGRHVADRPAAWPMHGQPNLPFNI